MKKASMAVAALAIAIGSFSGIARAGGGATDLASYSWTAVNEQAPWGGRAGLQAVELRGDLFVLGGRAAFNPLQTTIFADVWKSSDLGKTWSRTAPSAWPARAYFGAVQQADRIVVLGGQNFDTVGNPTFPSCPDLPPGAPCLPFIPNSTFFGDVWTSGDGATWTQLTASAGWEGRAGLSAVVHRGEIYVLGGSQGDDASTGGRGRKLFNDVWRSRDGIRWTQVTASAPWEPRAGAAVVVHDGYIYLLGGERGFTCGGAPFCDAQRDLYFNDVWRSRDGARWEQVTPSAGWSPRPGHQCSALLNQIVCFGGYGEPANPIDVWVSRDGASWKKVSDSPWNAASPDDGKYDFDALTVTGRGQRPSIMTFGGDRERFELPPDVNAGRVDDEVWRFGPN